MPKVSEEHERRRRQQILDAAMECFARNGYRATSIEDIVHASGLSVGALYTYYASKQELFLALAEQHTAQTLDAFRAIYERPGPMAEKNRESVELFFQQMAVELANYCRVSFEFWTEAPKSDALQAERAKLCDSIRQFIVWALTEARSVGELRPDVDIPAAAELILALDDGALLDGGLASPSGSLVASADSEQTVVTARS